jgi:hypothetical protein
MEGPDGVVLDLAANSTFVFVLEMYKQQVHGTHIHKYNTADLPIIKNTADYQLRKKKKNKQLA